jgi:hypothetical protein
MVPVLESTLLPQQGAKRPVASLPDAQNRSVVSGIPILGLVDVGKHCIVFSSQLHLPWAASYCDQSALGFRRCAEYLL